MRTKALILSAMLGAAGIVSSFAQGNVYSVNVVGYINLDLPAGFTMIANQLDNGQGNLVKDLLPTPPAGTSIYKRTGATYSTLSYLPGLGWLGNDVNTMTLGPGEGAFIQLANPATITFVGEVLQGDLVNPVVTGYDIYSSMVPQQGLLQTDLGYVPVSGDNIHRQRAGGGYNTSSYLTGLGWLGGEPTINVGESFWIQSANNKNWTRSFTVN